MRIVYHLVMQVGRNIETERGIGGRDDDAQVDYASIFAGHNAYWAERHKREVRRFDGI